MTESLYNAYLYDSPVLGKLGAQPDDADESPGGPAAISPAIGGHDAGRHSPPMEPADADSHSPTPGLDLPPPAATEKQPAPLKLAETTPHPLQEESPVDLPLPSDLEIYEPAQPTVRSANDRLDESSLRSSDSRKYNTNIKALSDRKGSATSESSLLPKHKPVKRKPTRPVHEMSAMTRLSYVNLLYLPLLIALGILAATCVPADYYRSRMSVTRLSIPQNAWRPDTTDGEVPSLNVNGGGVLTTSVWGWCWAPREDETK